MIHKGWLYAPVPFNAANISQHKQFIIFTKTKSYAKLFKGCSRIDFPEGTGSTYFSNPPPTYKI